MLNKMFKDSVSAFNNELNLEEAVAGRVRADQLSSIGQTKLYMMITNFISAAAVYFLTLSIVNPIYLSIWFGLVAIYTVLGLHHWWSTRNRVYNSTASTRGLEKTFVNCLILGSLWGVVPLMLYTSGQHVAQLTVVATICGMIGGSAIALNKMPKALVGLMVPLCLGTSVALIYSGRPVDIGIMAMLICFSVAVLNGAVGIFNNFVQSRVSQFENEEHLTTIEMLLNEFSESASDWLWESDSKGTFTRGHDHFESHLGLSAFSLDPKSKPKDCREDVSASDHRQREDVWKNMLNGQPFKNVTIPVLLEDETKWLCISGKPFFDGKGMFTGHRGVISDVSEIKKAEERIEFLAYNDALTGLVNRANFNAAADHSFKSTRDKWAIMYLDLDGFKQINDQYGHKAGDLVLIEVGKRLKDTIREKDVVARLGGDEFAIICKSAKDEQKLSTFAEGIVAEISKPYVLEGQSLEISVSVGISIAGDDGDNFEKLMNNADLALYRAKAEGKATHRFYEISMDELVKQRRTMENNLRESVRNKSLSVSFQPLVSSDKEITTGFEALARWYHPEHGHVSPANFIPIAERIGLICEIGEWVLKEACMQAVTWPDDLTIAVNLSPQQFTDNKIVDIVRNVLEETGLEPKRLELEITEGIFIENTEHMLKILNELKEVGVSIALDDFGTGYSSLSYLLKFPFDKLKIDRSLISTINQDSVARDVLQSIAKLGHILKLNVTAEGVETKEQVELLRQMECTHFQGYHFSKPLDSSDMYDYIYDRLGQCLADTVLKAHKGQEDKQEEDLAVTAA